MPADSRHSSRPVRGHWTSRCRRYGRSVSRARHETAPRRRVEDPTGRLLARPLSASRDSSARRRCLPRSTTRASPGAVHRDLKPANIKLPPDGAVKVLDFGLAKLTQPSGSGAFAPVVTASPTITTPAMTGIGVILDTAAYLAPEQARGKPVDKRADVWAFGCVLTVRRAPARRSPAGQCHRGRTPPARSPARSTMKFDQGGRRSRDQARAPCARAGQSKAHDAVVGAAGRHRLSAGAPLAGLRLRVTTLLALARRDGR
jgi:hypothetical protein